jgi:hypothetical protein
VEFEFSGKILYWRGPAPWFFVRVPTKESELLRTMSADLSYGWGCIPVHVRMGDSRWRTSLFPKDDHYLVPIKASVREAEGVDAGSKVTISMTLVR